MNRGTANRLRLLIYLAITWLLLWSLIRMLFFPQQLTSGSILGSAEGRFVLLFTGIVAIAWALGGPLLLSHWPRVSSRIIEIADSSRRANVAVWLFPPMAWLLAYCLITVAWSINPAMVDGPVIVLVLSGYVVLVVLTRHGNRGREGNEEEAHGPRQSRPGRLEKYWNSLPAVARHILTVLLLGLVVVLLIRKTLFDADVVVYGMDIQSGYYSLEVYISKVLRSGHIPFWNPYIYSGSPLFAQPQNLVFYPPQFILRMLPPNLSISWAIAFHVWIAGAGMYALARWKGFRFWISFLCAMVYMLNSGLLLRVFAGHVWLVYAFGWLPLVWLSMMAALNTGRIFAMVAAALGMSIIFLTGHPTFPIYILLFFGLYLLWICYGNWQRTRSWHSVTAISGRFLAIVALAFGLSAFQLIPTLVYYSQVAVSQGYGASGANFLTISLAELTAFFVPNFYTAEPLQVHYWELVPYVGVLFLLLIPFPYLARRADWFRDYLTVSAVISLAIALGGSIGIYFVLYYFLPPFRVARIPPRSLVIFVPAVTVLGGIALQTIVERKADARLFALVTRAYLFSGIFIFGVAIGVWFDNSALVRIPLSPIAVRPLQLAIGALLFILVYVKVAGLIPAATTRARSVAFALALFILGLAFGILLMPASHPTARQLVTLSLLIVFSTLLLTRVYNHGARPVLVVGLMLLVFFDLFSTGRMYVRADDPPVFNQESRLALKDVELQEFDRVLSYVDEPNQYMLGQVSNIDGYYIVLSGYDHFLRGLSGASQSNRARILLDGTILDPRALSFLGARYVLSGEPIEDESFDRIVAGDDFYLYENPSVLPRAFVVYDAVYAATTQDALALLRDPSFDYASQVIVEDPRYVGAALGGEVVVEIVDYSEADGGMLVRVETDGPGILVLSEPYYSERSVRIDGRETDMLRVNLGFIGVAVPAGAHEVELGYVPTSLYIGGTVTIFSLLVVLVTVVYTFAHRSRRVEDEAGSR